MTRKEIIETLRAEAENGEQEAIVLMSEVRKYMPSFLSYPDSARRHDVERYNSLARAYVHDTCLLHKVIIPM